MDPCRSCGEGTELRLFSAREMMHGTREEFPYTECLACGTIQIARIPRDLGRFYPANYYTHRVRPPGRLWRFLKRRRAAYLLGSGGGLLGRALAARTGVPDWMDWVRRVGLQPGHSVLDVGCGSGGLLLELSLAGFRSLTGVDPFIPASRTLPGGARLRKEGIEAVRETFDLVILNHSLEHVPDPSDTLGQVARVLRPGGAALIRVPVAGSYAWRRYQADWVQLDPPRHLWVPSERGMRLIAASAGLDVVEVVYDASDFQFWGSEQYQAGIPLFDDPRSVTTGRRRSIFTQEQLRRFAARAAELNGAGDGDQASFYLRKPAPR